MLMKTSEAANYLGVSASFLEKERVLSGRIPYTRLGKRKGIRYCEEDLQTFISSSTFRSTSEYPEESHHGE
jgi:excisionase family DNA binding protein